MAYSVNSDAFENDDRLHLINLADGSSVSIGIGAIDVPPNPLIDIEGLAFAPDNSLWGVDDETYSLFEVETAFGNVKQGTRVTISGLDALSKNDFGLTFTCDGSLYASSVITQTLYTIDEAGVAAPVGNPGNLGFNISAIASFGDSPVRLFGLGNGLIDTNSLDPDNRSLFEIDTGTGVATAIGVGIGGAVADYHQAGLSFDESGKLWAITDRSALGQFSQVLSIDINSGEATLESTVAVLGFESLAVSRPTGCTPPSGISPERADALIPTLDDFGKLLAILALMLTGFAGLRHRMS